MIIAARPYAVVTVLAFSLAAGCAEPALPAVDAGPGDANDDAGPTGLPVLGGYSHDPAAVDVAVILTAEDRLAGPRDVAFRPAGDHELWIVNEGDSSLVIVSNAGTPDQVVVRHRGPGADHFMPQPSALAFGEATFVTVHEMDELTQPETPLDFMGPTLWPADPEAFTGGQASHLDMLHNSPNSVGVEWEVGNAFWVFDGAHASLTRYDFMADHGPGREDHRDGMIQRYVEGSVGYVPDVGSHLVLDHGTNLLYVADTGNRRIAVLDVTSGTGGSAVGPNYDGALMMSMEGSVLATFVDGAPLGIEQPSGIALAGQTLYLTDHATSFVHAFDLMGTQLDWLDLSSVIEPNSIGGIATDPEGRLYVVDTTGERVIRLAARTP